MREYYNRILDFAQRDFYGLVGFLFFGVFFVHAIVFYKECIAFQDYSWEATYYLNKSGFNMVYFRWGSLLWKVFLIAGPYLHMSLKTILILTSVWFIFLKFCIWYLCHFRFKNVFAGLLVVLSLLLAGSKGYYAHGWQIHNAILFFCLLFAVLLDKDGIMMPNRTLRVVTVAALIVIIQGTYAAITLLCPLLILFVLDRLRHKVVFLVLFSVFELVAIQYFSPIYESNIFESMIYVLKTKKLEDFAGILFHLAEDVVSLHYLIPLIFFGISMYSLIKVKDRANTMIFPTYVLGLSVVLILKLATYKTNYPLSETVEYYLQGIFYHIWILIMSITLFLAHKYNKNIYHRSMVKFVTVFVLIFYSSGIFSEGIRHLEYNRYVLTLMNELKTTFTERIFIIDENYIPKKFSKINMNVDYETLLKSNLEFDESIVLYVTAHPEPQKVGEDFPVFINSLSSLENSRELFLKPEVDLARIKNESDDKALRHYKYLHPNTYFLGFNKDYFNFVNYRYKILNKEFMNEFNKDYGFSISDYY